MWGSPAWVCADCVWFLVYVQAAQSVVVNMHACVFVAVSLCAPVVHGWVVCNWPHVFFYVHCSVCVKVYSEKETLSCELDTSACVCTDKAPQKWQVWHRSALNYHQCMLGRHNSTALHTGLGVGRKLLSLKVFYGSLNHFWKDQSCWVLYAF